MYLNEINAVAFASPFCHQLTAVVGANTTILALFQANVLSTLKAEHFPVPSYTSEIGGVKITSDCGTGSALPCVRRLISGNGGTLYVDTAAKTNQLVTLFPGVPLDMLVCGLRTGGTASDVLLLA